MSIDKKLKLIPELDLKVLERQINDLKKRLGEVSTSVGVADKSLAKAATRTPSEPKTPKQASPEALAAKEELQTQRAVAAEAKKLAREKQREEENVLKEVRKFNKENVDLLSRQDAERFQKVKGSLDKQQKQEKELTKIRGKLNEESWEEYFKLQEKAHKDRLTQIEKENKAKLKGIKEAQDLEEKTKGAYTDLLTGRLVTPKDQAIARAREEERQRNPKPDLGGGLRNLGRIGGLLAGVGTLGAVAGDTASELRQLRILRADREQLQTMGELRGQGAEAAIDLSGRQDPTARILGGAKGGGIGLGAGGLAGGIIGGGLGLLVGPAGAVVGAKIGAVAGAAISSYIGALTGAEAAGKEEGQTRLAENQTGLAALGMARGSRENVRDLLRGGRLTEKGILSQVRTSADEFALTPEQTFQDLRAVRNTLGNRNAANPILMNTFQRLREQTGIEVGESSATAELFGGVSNQGAIGGAIQVQRVLEKAFSTGMDASKTSKFLQSTSQFIEQTAGFATVDPSRTGKRLADLTANFAGGSGQISDIDITRAREAQTILQQESFGTSGLAGVGNVLGIQNALGENATAEQFLAATALSSNASIEDIQKILGVDETTAKAVSEAKNNVTGTGIEALGIDQKSALGLFLAQQQRGGPIESQLGFQRGLTGPGATGPEVIPEFNKTSEAFLSAQEAAKRSAESLSEGFTSLIQETEIMTKTFEKFTNEVSKQTATVSRVLRDIGRGN